MKHLNIEEGLEWIITESFYFDNIGGREFSWQILDGGIIRENMVLSTVRLKDVRPSKGWILLPHRINNTTALHNLHWTTHTTLTQTHIQAAQ